MPGGPGDSEFFIAHMFGGSLMTAVAVTIEGKTIMYLPKGVLLAETSREEVTGFDFLEDRQLNQHPRLRRVLTRLVRPTPQFYAVLHWSDGS